MKCDFEKFWKNSDKANRSLTENERKDISKKSPSIKKVLTEALYNKRILKEDVSENYMNSFIANYDSLAQSEDNLEQSMKQAGFDKDIDFIVNALPEKGEFKVSVDVFESNEKYGSLDIWKVDDLKKDFTSRVEINAFISAYIKTFYKDAVTAVTLKRLKSEQDNFNGFVKEYYGKVLAQDAAEEAVNNGDFDDDDVFWEDPYDNMDDSYLYKNESLKEDINDDIGKAFIEASKEKTDDEWEEEFDRLGLEDKAEEIFETIPDEHVYDVEVEVYEEEDSWDWEQGEQSGTYVKSPERNGVIHAWTLPVADKFIDDAPYTTLAAYIKAVYNMPISRESLDKVLKDGNKFSDYIIDYYADDAQTDAEDAVENGDYDDDDVDWDDGSDYDDDDVDWDDEDR